MPSVCSFCVTAECMIRKTMLCWLCHPTEFDTRCLWHIFRPGSWFNSLNDQNIHNKLGEREKAFRGRKIHFPLSWQNQPVKVGRNSHHFSAGAFAWSLARAARGWTGNRSWQSSQVTTRASWDCGNLLELRFSGMETQSKQVLPWPHQFWSMIWFHVATYALSFQSC